MVFLSNEDKETWENYKLNMHKLRFDPKKIDINSNIKNQNKTLLMKSKKNKIFNNTFEKFIKLLNKRKIEPDGIIDLHGLKLQEAKLILKNYIFQAYNNDRRNILIITGKGLNKTGVLKKEVPIWLNEREIKKILISYENAPKSFGGEGALIIRLKNKEKVSI